MAALLKNKGIIISPTICHKYMNCVILYLYDRSVIASVTDRNITA